MNNENIHLVQGQQKQKTYVKMREDADLSLEVVILLVLGVFMLLFSLLLFGIHTGDLPYTPDSTYGLFLVIVSFQIITMGKTPFGDLRRSWMVVIIGICTAILGMFACFIPGYLTAPTRILVGIILFVGGIALLLQLFISEEKAKKWMKISGILQQLTIACGLVYMMSGTIRHCHAPPRYHDRPTDSIASPNLWHQFFLSRVVYSEGYQIVSS